MTRTELSHRIRLDVFGRAVMAELQGARWRFFYLGEGKMRPADLFVPDGSSEADMIRGLADLCHEWATARHPDVARVE